MAQLGRILCVCKGNSDRSPMMAGVLEMFLRNAGHHVVCQSAGILDVAASGCASPYAIVAGSRMGIDISNHCRRQIKTLKLDEYSLFICMDEEIAAEVMNLGVDHKQIYNAKVGNCWPVQFQEDYDSVTVPQILAAAYRVVSRYFAR